MKILYIGCVQSSYRFLSVLIKNKSDIVGVVTKKESVFNADFVSLSPIAQANNIPFIFAEDAKDKMLGWIKEKDPDVIYCFGWSQLLSQDILEIPRKGTVGYHPAALPRNRGRHPIIWAIALGLKETASTFFLVDEGADSGNIISQLPVAIDINDDAESLYEKLLLIGEKQVLELTQQFEGGEVLGALQDHSQANYWRKRSKQDGQIDWRMPANGVYNLIRSLSKPYPGAHCIYKGKEVKVWKSKVEEIQNVDHIEPGKILDIEESKISIKCGVGVLQLIQHEFEPCPLKGEYL